MHVTITDGSFSFRGQATHRVDCLVDAPCDLLTLLKPSCNLMKMSGGVVHQEEPLAHESGVSEISPLEMFTCKGTEACRAPASARGMQLKRMAREPPMAQLCLTMATALLGKRSIRQSCNLIPFKSGSWAV